jgi:hypothetical protein
LTTVIARSVSDEAIQHFQDFQDFQDFWIASLALAMTKARHRVDFVQVIPGRSASCEPGISRDNFRFPGLRLAAHPGMTDLAAGAYTAAMQSISISKRPNHCGTQTKIRAGGSFGKYRA